MDSVAAVVGVAETNHKINDLDAQALKRIRAMAALELAVRTGVDMTREDLLDRAEAYLKFVS